MSLSFQDSDKNRAERRHKRLMITAVVLALSYFVVMGRAVQLALQDNEQLEEIAMSQYRLAIQQETERSRILDARGDELAISIPSWSLYADPSKVSDPAFAASKLAKVLHMAPATLRRKLKRDSRFVWLKRHTDAQTMEAVNWLSLKGIFGIKEMKRFYPSGSLAGALLGAVGVDQQALGGIELAYNPYLMVNRRTGAYLKDARGERYQVFKPMPNTTEESGHLYLTIDKNIQFFAESALQTAIETSRAKSGVVLLANPATGAILAMANWPPFDPNHYQNLPYESWRNRSVTDLYEPGSTFKTVMAAAAIEDKKISLYEKFNCEKGKYPVSASFTLTDHNPYDRLTLSEIIRVSSNIGILKVGQRVGREKFYQKIMSFGFGEKTGIDYPGEQTGIVKAPAKWNRIDAATMSYGHGISVTPLQVLMAMGAIANNGQRMKPYLVEKVLANSGKLLYQAAPQRVAMATREETAKTLKTILQGVVTQGGTSLQAAIPGYSVAGKTGTARKVDPENRGYLEGKYISSFVGFSPVKKARLVALVLLDEPEGKYYGGEIAGPVFRQVVEQSLKYLGIPPDANGGTAWVQKERGLPYQEVPLTQEGEFFRLPDFQGASLRHILKTIERFPVRLEVKGTGVVVSQKPGPGTLVSADSTLKVELESFYEAQ